MHAEVKAEPAPINLDQRPIADSHAGNLPPLDSGREGATPGRAAPTTTQGEARTVTGFAALVYGALSYGAFLVTFLYAVGFVADLWVPKTIDSGFAGSIGGALAVDLGLLTLFALQHSVMARPAFKRRWTRIVPRYAERSTYVLASSLVLALIFWQWRPLPGLVWSLDGPPADLLWGLYCLGWGLVLASSFLISHAHLFGLQQVYRHHRGRRPQDPPFQVNGLYRHVRHPIMVGFIIAFWSAPQMSWGRLLFAAASTAYILLALRFEEHDLASHFGVRYREYRKRVPMLVPRLVGLTRVRGPASSRDT